MKASRVVRVICSLWQNQIDFSTLPSFSSTSSFHDKMCFDWKKEFSFHWLSGKTLYAFSFLITSEHSFLHLDLIVFSIWFLPFPLSFILLISESTASGSKKNVGNIADSSFNGQHNRQRQVCVLHQSFERRNSKIENNLTLDRHTAVTSNQLMFLFQLKKT